MLSKARIFFIVPAIVLIAAGASATVLQVGTLSNGPVFSITESNGYIYAGHGGEIQVYDATSRDKILALNWSSRIAKFPYEGTKITGIIIRGDILYASDSNGHLIIGDITEPANPVILSNTLFGNTAIDVSEDGNTIYIGGSSLSVIDATDKTKPVKIGSVSAGNYIWRLKTQGNLVYAALGNGEGNPDQYHVLSIFNVTNRSAPVRITFLSMRGYTSGSSGVAIKDNYLYLVDYYNALRTLDITNPAAPLAVKNISMNGANDAFIQGNYLYISTRYEGFRIYDITNPANPVYTATGWSETGGYTEGIFVDGNYVFLAIESMGWEVYDISVKTAPKRLQHVFTIGGVDSMLIKDNYAYIGAHNDGIWILDISDITNIKEVAFSRNNGRNVGLGLVGTDLYVAGSWRAMSRFDVTDPLNPTLKLNDWGDDIWSLKASKLYADYLYTGAGMVNVANRSNPVYGNRSITGGIEFGGHYLLTCPGGSIGWRVLDISDINNPVVVPNSSFEPNRNTGGYIYGGYTVYKDNIVIATAANDVMFYDISNLSSPRLLKRFWYGNGQWAPTGVVLVGDYVYITGSGNPSMRIYSVPNRTVMESGNTGISYWAGNYLYGLGKFGIRVYSSTYPIPTPVPTPTPTPTPTPEPTTISPTETPTPTEIQTTPIPTTEPTPEPTDPMCVCPTSTTLPPNKVCIEITTMGMRLIPCP